MPTEVGINVRDVSTPAVVIDLDVVERNLVRMTDYCSTHRIGLRPHTKTHKTIEAARRQLELGAIGLTVAKVGEAEVMAAADAKEILVAHPIIGDEKLRRLAALTPKTGIIVAVDSLTTAQSLSRIAVETGCQFGVLIEFDSGALRCGVAAGPHAAELGKQIARLPNLKLRGLFTYFGSVWGDPAERTTEIERLKSNVSTTIAAFLAAGLSTEIVSAGSTPAAELSHLVPGITEIRPGTYIYNDLNTHYQGLCSLDDCAVSVVTTVVSTAVPGHVIVDAGSKTLSSDLLSAGPKHGHGYVREADATLTRLNEEHGFLSAKNLSQFSVGQVLAVIPNHVCTCINMHDEVLVARGGKIVGSWNVDARGKVR
jgi:D-serine deaminase-like pyridoxal phosphate-dependent protein